MSETEKYDIDTTLAFDTGKQAAIVGWCLRDKLFCKQCSFALKEEFFSSPSTRKVFGAVMKLYKDFHEVPTPEDVNTYRPFTQEDARSQQRLKEALSEALAKSQRYSLEILRSEMTEWIHAVVFHQAVQSAVTIYNAKKVKEAWGIVEKAVLFKGSATFEDGFNQGFLPSSERILNERAERMEQAKKVLRYGNGFLDDALGGIIPNDLIVLGAATGSGKTQMATSISLENSLAGGEDGNGVPVHYFALEAEEGEIERRIKFGLVSAAFHSEHKESRLNVGYGDWRMGKLDKLLGPYEERMAATLAASVKNLNTLYRTSGSFDMNSLENHLLDVVTESRLIVVDHLHYIDTEGDDENRGYKRVVKLVRDIVLHYHVPVILIAHLRKKQGGRNQHTIMPVIDDFHGTSDVPKISTTCIMMAPAYDHAVNHSWQYPTYIAAVKSRLEGSRMRYAGLVNFDSRTSRYEHAYRLAKMSELQQNGSFEDLIGNQIPAWANPLEPQVTTSSLG
jgi:replicative DNA helicase